MADSVPSGDTAVFALVEMFALAFAFEGTSLLLNGGGAMKVTFAYIAAVALLVAGMKWPFLKEHIGHRLSDSVTRLANDARVWFIALLVVFGFVSAPGLFTRTAGVVVPSEVFKPDLRLAPFAPNAKFFTELSTDPSQSSIVACFPFDPASSCSIAARYRDRLADHWTPDGPVVFLLNNPVPVAGIAIVTPGEHRPTGALELRSKLRDIGIDAAFPVAPDLHLQANEFAVVIGGKP
jgi:hypothetical protein